MLNRLENVLPDVVCRRLSSVSSIVFDVDRTLAEPHGPMSESILSELVNLRVPAGVATARTLAELEHCLPGGSGVFDIFRGDLLLEDGSVLVRGGQSSEVPVQVEALVAKSELESITELRTSLRDEFVDLNRADGFGMFKGLPEPLIKFPPFNDFLTSITIWEKGDVGEPTFALAYSWVRERLRERGLESALSLTEVGDGTLRVTVPGVNKGWGLKQLADRRGLDLSKLAYFGDGANDIPAALTVKQYGGLVFCVGSSTPALAAIADYVTNGEGPESVEKVLQRLNRLSR
jgi:hypothetical protein